MAELFSCTDYDKLESRMHIEIISSRLSEPAMLVAVLARCGRYGDDAKKITITCGEPDPTGALMYMMVVEYISGGSITIGALRRVPGGEVEFNS